MATDSSSGTLPSSSRFTIDSSSSIARSKGSCPISLLSFWAIAKGQNSLISASRNPQGRGPRPQSYTGLREVQSGRAGLRMHQGGDMGGNRVAERLQVIAAFEQRDDTATGTTVGHIHDLLRGPDEIGLGQIDVGERVAHMRVK